MAHINIYTNKKAQVLAWQKVYTEHGYDCKAIERTGMNGRPGQAKYCLTIYSHKNGTITQSEYNEFEERVNAIFRTL